jgi:hypothetical protein
MRFSNSLALATLAVSAQAIGNTTTDMLNSLTATNSKLPLKPCPTVWFQISGDLTAMFLTRGQCNDDARAAIRAGFHDCFPDGGCDGSLALPDEISRPENTPMTQTVLKLAALAKTRSVGVADMIAFAACK